MPWHTVQQGEHLPQIAHRYGFSDHQAIFDLPENKPLKDKKRCPHILHPGDQVFIPEKEVKEEDAPTGKLSTFKVKIPKVMLRVVLHDEEGQPFASKAYKLEIDGQETEGETDGDGLVEAPIPVGAKGGKVEIEGHVFPLRIGHLDPLEELSGIQSRLANIGFDLGGERGTLGPGTAGALKWFQKIMGLEATGDLDDATRDKLKEKHFC